MGFKHSPAPWRCHDKRPNCSGYSIVGNDGQYIGFVGDSDELSPMDANANLIAAAPELLEALQSLLTYGCITGDDWVIEKAEAAISKALGQQ
ncbi:hypothetical protein AB7V82_21635 [Providencia stuartii]|uniref:hypothetical protein n=1 Tax=Providencia TaxID=586 RepID=UPI0034D7072D